VAFYLTLSKAHPEYTEMTMKAYDIVTKQLNAIASGKTTASKDKSLNYDVLRISCIFKLAECDVNLQNYVQGWPNNPVLIEKINILEKEVINLKEQNTLLQKKLQENNSDYQQAKTTPEFFKRL
jgi:hypothetical protein